MKIQKNDNEFKKVLEGITVAVFQATKDMTESERSEYTKDLLKLDPKDMLRKIAHRELGLSGGAATKKRYGKEHYKMMGQKSAQKRWNWKKKK